MITRRRILQYASVGSTAALAGCQFWDTDESAVEIGIYTNRDETEVLNLELTNGDDETLFSQLIEVPPSDSEQRNPFDSDEWYYPAVTIDDHFDVGESYQLHVDIADGDTWSSTVRVDCSAEDGGDTWIVRLQRGVVEFHDTDECRPDEDD